MPRYLVHARWEGQAETVIEAASEDEAERIGLMDTWCAFDVRGGHIGLFVSVAEELEADDA